MKISELIKGKHIIVKKGKYGPEYLKEDLKSYAKEINEACLFESTDVPKHIKFISVSDYHLGKHEKLKEYAVALSTLLMLM